MKEKEKEIHDRLERLAQNLNAQGKLSMNDVREFAICDIRAIPENHDYILPSIPMNKCILGTEPCVVCGKSRFDDCHFPPGYKQKEKKKDCEICSRLTGKTEKLTSDLSQEELAFLEKKKFTANKIREAFGIKPISKEILEQLSKPPLEEEAFETLASYIFSNAFARGHEYGQRGGLKPMEKMKEISKESTKELLNLLRYFSIELKEK